MKPVWGGASSVVQDSFVSLAMVSYKKLASRNYDSIEVSPITIADKSMSHEQVLNILQKHGNSSQDTVARNFEVELLHDAKGIGYWFISKVTLTNCILCSGIGFTW